MHLVEDMPKELALSDPRTRLLLRKHVELIELSLLKRLVVLRLHFLLLVQMADKRRLRILLKVIYLPCCISLNLTNQEPPLDRRESLDIT